MSKRNGSKSINEMAKKAMREAVAETIRDHARTGDPIYIWEKGKVVRIPATRLRKK